MTNYEIDENLLKGVIEYLAKRPYIEVSQALNALQQLKPCEDKKSPRNGGK